MPGGFGGNDLGKRVDDALRGITIQGEARSDGLAKAAVEAVARLATVDDHPVPAPQEAATELAATDAGTRGGASPLVYPAPAPVLFAGVFVTGRRERPGSG